MRAHRLAALGAAALLALCLANCKPAVDPNKGRFSCATAADCGSDFECKAQAAGGSLCFKKGTCVAEACNGRDDDCNGVVDETFPNFDKACGSGRPGVCAAGKVSCVDAGEACLSSVVPSAEVCNGLDDDCNGQADEGDPGSGAACLTGLQGICAPGTTICRSGAVVCGQNLQPRTEVCNGLDDDCEGAADTVAGGCSLFLTGPLDGESLDCSAGSVPPTITWDPAQYDRYRVYVSWSRKFVGTHTITSGDTMLDVDSWTVPRKKWRKVCDNMWASIYIRVLGVDRDVPDSDPSRKFKSPTVTATAHR